MNKPAVFVMEPKSFNVPPTPPLQQHPLNRRRLAGEGRGVVGVVVLKWVKTTAQAGTKDYNTRARSENNVSFSGACAFRVVAD